MQKNIKFFQSKRYYYDIIMLLFYRCYQSLMTVNTNGTTLSETISSKYVSYIKNNKRKCI